MRRTWIWVVLALLLAAVLINDVSRIAATHFSADTLVVSAADTAAVAVRQAGDSDDAFLGYQAAARALASEDTTIVAYTQEDGRIFVRVEASVTGAFVIVPIASLWAGGEWTDPLLVTKEYERPI